VRQINLLLFKTSNKDEEGNDDDDDEEEEQDDDDDEEEEEKQQEEQFASFSFTTAKELKKQIKEQTLDHYVYVSDIDALLIKYKKRR
jgi:TATA-binding protein-associated factor Taf7